MKYILVIKNLYLCCGAYSCLSDTEVPVGTTEQIHYTEVPVGTTRLILILVYQILFLYFESCTQILYVYYGTYTCLTELILILQNLYGSYESYSCAKVPVGTMSWNISGSYHIQGQIRLLQKRTLVFRRYRSQIHYTEVTVVTTGLILISKNLYLFYRYETTRRYYRAYTYFTDTRVPLGTTGLILIQTSRRSYRVSSYAEFILITDVCSFGTPVGVTELIQIQEYP